MDRLLPYAGRPVVPSVFATVIGAWIVTHYVNPENVRRSVQGKDRGVSSGRQAAPLNGASEMTPRPVENVAVRPTAVEQPDPSGMPARRLRTEKAATPSKETNKERQGHSAIGYDPGPAHRGAP